MWGWECLTNHIRSFWLYAESQTLQTDYLASNSSLCYTVPDSLGVYLVWPQNVDNMTDFDHCTCVALFTYFERCPCAYETNYMVNISSDGSACFYNLTPAMSGTLVHFLTLTDICTGSLNCIIINILSSYRIIILGTIC